jgi:lysine 6-dehydrogenase
MGSVAILGSGIVGTAAAWDMTRRGHDVIVADADAAAADTAGTIASAQAIHLDATDGDAVRRLFEQVELVVSGIPYRFGPATARAAVDTATHYVDFGGNPTIVRQQLELDADARAVGVCIVPDCGLAPGMANVLATGVVANLGDGGIDELRLRVGALPSVPTGALGYQLAFNPAGLINEYAEPCEVLHNGKFATEEPLTGVETLEWAPFGELEAFHTAGGSSSLPSIYAGRISELDYKTIRFPGHVGSFRAMLEIGLFDETPQPGTKVAPREVLLEALAQHLPSGADDLVLVRVWGRKGESSVGYQIVDRSDDKFSALARTTAFPATALAHLMLEGRIQAGATSMDGAMTADDLVNELEPVGIVIEPYSV